MWPWSQVFLIFSPWLEQKRTQSPNQWLHIEMLLFCLMSDPVTPWTAARQAPLSFVISQSWLRFMSIELVMLSSHLILCHPLILLPSVFPCISVFSCESALCIRQPKYWSFSFSISPSNEYSGLISFRIDWFDLLTVQGTLKSLLQHYSLKASFLWQIRWNAVIGLMYRQVDSQRVK